MKTNRTYSEFINLPTFQERFEYLKLSGKVCERTFGADRYLNQAFYRSSSWRSIRDKVIIRDSGCDLGIYGRTIYDRIYVHHMNPITIEDIENANKHILNPEYLVCTSPNTHNAIHYGDVSLLILGVTVRSPRDTCPWKKKT